MGSDPLSGSRGRPLTPQQYREKYPDILADRASGMTLDAVGAKHNRTRERIRQIEVQAQARSPNPQNPNWDESDKAEIRTMWSKGVTVLGIARHFGVKKNCISGLTHRMGLPSRPSPIKRAS